MRASERYGSATPVPVEDYEHSDAHRLNNPPAGLAHLDRDETPVRTLQYDPHLDPQLMWAVNPHVWSFDSGGIRDADGVRLVSNIWAT